jgi:hypothetical protein
VSSPAITSIAVSYCQGLIVHSTAERQGDAVLAGAVGRILSAPNELVPTVYATAPTDGIQIQQEDHGRQEVGEGTGCGGDPQARCGAKRYH